MSSTWDNIKSLVQMQYTKSFLSNHPDKDMHPYIYIIYIISLGNLLKMGLSKLFYSQTWRKIDGKMFSVS